jgi:hypothetical protein
MISFFIFTFLPPFPGGFICRVASGPPFANDWKPPISAPKARGISSRTAGRRISVLFHGVFQGYLTETASR